MMGPGDVALAHHFLSLSYPLYLYNLTIRKYLSLFNAIHT